ncbi:hypothetical protein FB446DRAFT_795799 [Lentinula raphanica]|nr:hypothetical protein FB446DRAFT_795799 [Lentinula raphanica]
MQGVPLSWHRRQGALKERKSRADRGNGPAVQARAPLFGICAGGVAAGIATEEPTVSAPIVRLRFAADSGPLETEALGLIDILNVDE